MRVVTAIEKIAFAMVMGALEALSMASRRRVLDAASERIRFDAAGDAKLRARKAAKKGQSK